MMLAISNRAISKHLKILQEQRIIRRVGADRGGYWEGPFQEGSVQLPSDLMREMSSVRAVSAGMFFTTNSLLR